MTSFNLIIVIKPPSPNIVPLGVRVSIHEFWGDKIQSIKVVSYYVTDTRDGNTVMTKRHPDPEQTLRHPIAPHTALPMEGTMLPHLLHTIIEKTRNHGPIKNKLQTIHLS